jgi:hypothetical protein
MIGAVDVTSNGGLVLIDDARRETVSGSDYTDGKETNPTWMVW